MISGNLVAWGMLLIWPLVARQFYVRMDPARALIWTILAGYLMLPPVLAINLPLVPDFTKFTIPSLAALLWSWLILKDRVRFDPGYWPERILMLAYVLSTLGTVLTNREPLVFAQAVIPAMKLYDSASAIATQLIALLPFVLARRYLAGPGDLRQIVLALAAAGLVYSVPMLIETILSPQLNLWIYGYFQHDFFQTLRGGGYRPVVFLPHGLWVAFFAFMAAAAAAIVLRDTPPDQRPRRLAILLYLVFMVVMCKSAGALVFTLFALPLLVFVNRRVIVVVAAAIAVLVVIYPILRGAHLVPLQAITDLAASFSPDRAGSLTFRILNEDLLLEHAARKPWFGWGGFNRSFLHDPVTGGTTVIADGSWIIVLGINGWVGYIASFGLLALPLLRLARLAWSQHETAISPFATGLALILAMNLLDMLPNATEIPFTWLMAGALFGYVDRLRAALPEKPGQRPLRVVIG